MIQSWIMLQFILNILWALELLSDFFIHGSKAFNQALRVPIETVCQILNLIVLISFVKDPNDSSNYN
jgi:hypothetical protein